MGQLLAQRKQPGKSGTTCRAGSGDLCDLAETCTGTPGATCPADDAAGNAPMIDIPATTLAAASTATITLPNGG